MQACLSGINFFDPSDKTIIQANLNTVRVVPLLCFLNFELGDCVLLF